MLQRHSWLISFFCQSISYQLGTNNPNPNISQISQIYMNKKNSVFICKTVKVTARSHFAASKINFTIKLTKTAKQSRNVKK